MSLNDRRERRPKREMTFYVVIKEKEFREREKRGKKNKKEERERVKKKLFVFERGERVLVRRKRE